MSESTALLSDPQKPSALAHGAPPQPTDLPPGQGAAPPPPYQYQQPPPQTQQYQTAVTAPPTQTVVLNQVVFSDTPVQIHCPHCQQNVITTVNHETGMLTWLAVGILFLLGFWLCCWIPLLLNALKDVVHTCPNCRYVCGVHKRL